MHEPWKSRYENGVEHVECVGASLGAPVVGTAVGAPVPSHRDAHWGQLVATSDTVACPPSTYH